MALTGEEGLMRTHFAEVLARESACLAGVTDGAKLAGWRRRVVEERMTRCRRTCWRCDKQVMCPSESTSSIGGASSSARRLTGCCGPAPRVTHTAAQARLERPMSTPRRQRY